jgi:hypothetical protein
MVGSSLAVGVAAGVTNVVAVGVFVGRELRAAIGMGSWLVALLQAARTTPTSNTVSHDIMPVRLCCALLMSPACCHLLNRLRITFGSTAECKSKQAEQSTRTAGLDSAAIAQKYGSTSEFPVAVFALPAYRSDGGGVYYPAG